MSSNPTAVPLGNESQLRQRLEQRLVDLHPATEILASEVLENLSRPQPQLPCKLFYDNDGSILFDKICALPEYYPTRTELAILRGNMDAIVAALGPRVELIEFGAGSGLKTRMLLASLHNPAAYVPIDISRQHLLDAALRFAVGFPQLEIIPVCADYTLPINVPEASGETARRVVYFPGSTIGNFQTRQAVEFLKVMAAECDHGGGLLIGVDLRKDPAVLEAAYNDSAGVTAQFNLNVLRRLNRELGAGFALDKWRHRAVWNDADSCIEMRLYSTGDQQVTAAGRSFSFPAGSYILTEHSYKYTLERFAQLARRAGFEVEHVWLDEKRLFSVQYLRETG